MNRRDFILAGGTATEWSPGSTARPMPREAAGDESTGAIGVHGVDIRTGEAGVTRRTLERRFATVQRRSIAKEIEVARLERARQLLAETSKSVKEVGFASGFSSPTRLIRVFRSRLGVTPGDYRADFVADRNLPAQP